MICVLGADSVDVVADVMVTGTVDDLLGALVEVSTDVKSTFSGAVNMSFDAVLFVCSTPLDKVACWDSLRVFVDLVM